MLGRSTTTGIDRHPTTRRALIDLYTYDGTIYGAPKDFDTVALWYNKELFDAAGVEYPSADWTWDDFKAAAAKLTDPAKGVYGIAASQYGQENYYNTIAQAGGEVITADGTKTGYDTPEALEGIELWTDLIDGRLVADGAADDRHRRPRTSSCRARSRCTRTARGPRSPTPTNPELADAVNVAPLPAGPEGNQRVIHGLGNVVNAKTTHLDAAKEFAAFASGEQRRRDPGRDRHRHPRLQRHPAGLGRRRCRSSTCRPTSTSSRPPCPTPSRRTPRRGRRSRARSSRRSGPARSRPRTACKDLADADAGGARRGVGP